MSAVLPPAAAVGARVDSTRPGATARADHEPHPPSAAERLDASRKRLRAALMEIAHPPAKPSMLDGLGLGSFAGDIVNRLKGFPIAAVVIETLEHWWAEHPLHTAGIVAEQASRKFVAPIAQRNPYALVLGSVVVGAVLALTRPWRWLIRPALLAGLVPQLATQALKHMPIESWVQMLAAFTAKSPASKPTAGMPDKASGLPKEI